MNNSELITFLIKFVQEKSPDVLQHTGLSRKLLVRSYLMQRTSSNEDHKVWRPL